MNGTEGQLAKMTKICGVEVGILSSQELLDAHAEIFTRIARFRKKLGEIAKKEELTEEETAALISEYMKRFLDTVEGRAAAAASSNGG